jgi:hypothetical protein
MTPDEYGKIIEEAAFERDGRKMLTCAKAFELSAEHSIPIGEIGSWCTDNGIRISMCQLGCFE